MTKHIAWMLPDMIEGSGGIRTILTKANALVEKGMVCDYYFYRHPHHMLPEMQAKAERFFQVKQGDFYCGAQLQKSYDLAIATAWDSMKVVRDLPVPHKASFIQDYEAWFNPVGDAHLFGETGFFYGLKSITLGRWLNRFLENKFGERPYLCNFGVDTSCYHQIADVQKENAICFIHQPEKPRRCVVTAIEALGIVKAMRPETTIYFYGSKLDPVLWYDIENLNLLTPNELCQLYNTVKVGLCMSASNPSRIPFEMMACGLPVVDLYKSNNLYDYPDNSIYLAHQAPESIAHAIIQVLDNQQLASSLSQGGLDFVANHPIASEHEDFCNAVDMIINNVHPQHKSTKPIYTINPVLADVYANDKILNFCEREKSFI